MFCIQIYRGLDVSVAVASRPGAEQPVASPRDRLQQFSIGTERLPNGGDLSLQGIFFDDNTMPNAVDKLILGDEVASRQDQDLDNLKRATADGNVFPLCAELASG
jgi:hypothetical protein